MPNSRELFRSCIQELDSFDHVATTALLEKERRTGSDEKAARYLEKWRQKLIDAEHFPEHPADAAPEKPAEVPNKVEPQAPQ